MKQLIQLESRINKFISRHERGSLRVLRGLATLVNLILINAYFGYVPFFSNGLMVLGLTIFCAMIPMSAVSIVLTTIMLIELYALSPQVALVALCLFLLAYFITSFYGSKHIHNIIMMPLAFPLQASYFLPMVSAITGGVQEVASVISGGILSYFLLVVRRNSSFLAEGDKLSTVPSLLLTNMFRNSLFYFSMVAFMLMFMVTYALRERVIRQSWRVAVGAGILTEFLVMMVGYLLTGNGRNILSLALVNLVLFAVGMVLSFFIKNLDYSRVETVSFEDDEYFYYVTAVPKIRLSEEKKQIKRITAEDEERRKHVTDPR